MGRPLFDHAIYGRLGHITRKMNLNLQNKLIFSKNFATPNTGDANYFIFFLDFCYQIKIEIIPVMGLVFK